jgi:1,2-diacylglycerol 3-alpha-glucosyltransferase
VTRLGSLDVAMVAPAFPPARGGIETHVQELVGHLAELGHDLTVFAPHRGAAVSENLPGGVTLHRFASVTASDRYPWAPRLARRLRAAIEAGEFDLVHVHGYHAAAALAALSVPEDVPVVFTPHYHGTGHTAVARAMHVVHRPLGRRLIERAVRIVCVSEAEATNLVQRFHEASGRVHVIPNGVRERPVPRGERSPTTLVTVSRLEYYKRVDRAVEALTALPGWRLFVVGDGPERASLARLVERRDLADRVVLAGAVGEPELNSLLGRAGVFVSLSEHEASGIGVLEALACGLPVVASDIPAHAEIARIVPGRVRLVGPDLEPAAVAALVRVAARQPVGRGLPGRFSWAEVAAVTEDLYRLALR